MTPPLHSTSPLNRRLLQIGLLLLLAYEFVCFLLWLPDHYFSDFFSFWAAGGLAAAEGGAVYDPTRLHAFEQASLGSFPQNLYYLYIYPPTLLLVLAPLSALPLGLAYTAWMGTTFALYVRATLGRHWRSWTGLFLLAAPTTFITLVAGQNGFLTATLFVGATRCLGKAPIAAGVLFGLLAYKPQFGVLIPVALLAARQWQTIAVACGTALACIALSAIVFGPSIWLAWIDHMPLYQHLLTDNRASYLRMMPTIAASVEQASGSPFFGNIIQAVATVTIAVLIWRCFAKDTERGTVPLLIGSMLATPYGFIYDLPMITAAFVLEWQWRRRQGLSLALWEVALAIGFLECASVMSAYTVPLAGAALLVGCLMAVLRARGSAALSPSAP